METVAACPNAPKLDPRVRRTRGLLEDAMRALMRERPFAEITVGDITERATVNRATFYAHYLDKEDLGRSVLRESYHAALVGALRPPRAFNPKSLVDVGAATFEYMASMHGACRKADDGYAHTLGSVVQATLEEFLRTWLTHEPVGRAAVGGASVETFALVASWALYGGALRWARLVPRPPTAEAAREIVGLLHQFT